MKIWLQLVSSSGRLPRFLQNVQAQCDGAASASTQVTVSGTKHGALGDQHAAFLHCDAHEILKLMQDKIVGHGYNVYIMGNSLDPALSALRELLDIPVVSTLQVGCTVAMTLGDRIGVIATNTKFGMAYQRLIEGYGLGSKLAGISGLSVIRAADLDAAFEDENEAAKIIEAVEISSRSLIAAGADILLIPGPIGTILSQHSVTQILGATIIDLYPTAVKIAEAMGHLALHCGMKTSRLGLYEAPSEESRFEANRIYDFGGLPPKAT